MPFSAPDVARIERMPSFWTPTRSVTFDASPPVVVTRFGPSAPDASSLTDEAQPDAPAAHAAATSAAVGRAMDRLLMRPAPPAARLGRAAARGRRGAADGRR